MTADDRLLLVLPLFHIYGLNAGLGLVARVGATCVLLDRFDARSSLAAIRDLGVTNVAGAPPMYVAWSAEGALRESMDGVRLMISGASALPPDVFHQFRTITGQPIWEGYGLTEHVALDVSLVGCGVPKHGVGHRDHVFELVPGIRGRDVEPAAVVGHLGQDARGAVVVLRPPVLGIIDLLQPAVAVVAERPLVVRMLRGRVRGDVAIGVAAQRPGVAQGVSDRRDQESSWSSPEYRSSSPGSSNPSGRWFPLSPDCVHRAMVVSRP